MRIARRPWVVGLASAAMVGWLGFQVWEERTARAQMDHFLREWPRTSPASEHVLTLRTPGAGSLSALSEAGGLFAAGVTDGATRIAEIHPWRVVGNSLKPARELTLLKFRPQTTDLLVADTNGNWQLWRTRPVRQVLTSGATGTNVIAAAFSTDGHYWALADANGMVRAWRDAGTSFIPVVRSPFPALVKHLHFDPPGKSLYATCQDGNVYRIDLVTGQMVTTGKFFGFAFASALATDGERLYLAALHETDAHGRGILWSVRTADGAVLATNGFHGHIRELAVSPDGGRIAEVSVNRTVRIWDAQLRPVAETGLHLNSVKAAEFSTDGLRLLTLDQEGTARLWNAQTGEPLTEVWRGTNGLAQIAFAADGFTAGSGDNSPSGTIWNLACPLPQGWDRPALLKALLADGRVAALRRAAWLSGDAPEVLRHLATATAAQGPDEMWRLEAEFLRKLADRRTK